MSKDTLNIASVRKPIVVDNKQTDKATKITVILGMNNQVDIPVTGAKSVGDLITEACSKLSLPRGKYMSPTRLLQKAYIGSHLVNGLTALAEPGAIVTVDEKKSNG